MTSHMQSLKCILLIACCHCLHVLDASPHFSYSDSLDPLNDDDMADVGNAIFRRWLSEAALEDSHATYSTAEFYLTDISPMMEDIILNYETALDIANISTTSDDDLHSQLATTTAVGEGDDTQHRRRLRRLLATSDAFWDCNTTALMSDSFDNISLQLELFNALTCTSEAHAEEHEEEHVPDGIYIVLYCAFVLFVGCMLKYVQHRYHIPIPYTVLLLITGAILEGIELADDDLFGELNLGFQQVRSIDPHMVLTLFIPGLIFESAFNTNYHIFLKEAKQAALLAGPGVVWNALLVGGLMHYFAHSISTISGVESRVYNWSWSFSIMFGSIVSATDPVAVVALLKELGASKRLSTLIEAESLLNDGTAFVMFSVLREYAASPEGTSVASMMITLLQLAGGGFVMGIFCGTVTYYALSKVYNDAEVEICITVSFVYLFAYTGDFVFRVSGVLVIVFMGLWVSKNREAISPSVEEGMHHFWEMVGFIANTLLFFITGQVITFRVSDESAQIHWPTDLAILFVLYVGCHVTRALAIWQLYPLLKNTGYGCTYSDAMVMVYGGLRGAIGLALALILETETAFDKIDRDRVLFHVCGIVVLTLVVNAPTVKYVVQYLGLNKPPSDTAALFRSSVQHLLEDVHHKISEMKLDKHYLGANWTKVENLQPRYDELYLSIFGEVLEHEEGAEDDERGDEELSVDSDEEAQNLIINMIAELQRADREAQQKNAVEKRVIQVMKSSYWGQYEHGLISADAVNILVESSEDAMDEHDLTKQRRNLEKWFAIPWYIKALHRSRFKYVKKVAEWMLFGNLGFAVEIASGFIYATKEGIEFCELLLHSHSVEPRHIVSVQTQLQDVIAWIDATAADVVRVYPEVHTAIQTLHAANALLNHQKGEIAHLLHKGFLDEAEFSRVMSCCEASLQQLFHHSYTSLLDIENYTDESILLNAPLFSELAASERKQVLDRCRESKWYHRGDKIVRAGTRPGAMFVITRGTVFVYADGRSHVHTKHRGDVLDVYSLLQQHEHELDFVVSTDQCFGYWLDEELLAALKNSNIDFWDSLWKCAAADVVRYHFKEQLLQHMHATDLTSLDAAVYASPLSFFDPHNRYRCQVRVTRGLAVLLSGSVVHISDMHSKASAPALLPCADEPYVAVEDAVVLNLDFQRQDLMHLPATALEGSGQTSTKLAKLCGVSATIAEHADGDGAEDDDADDDFEYDDEDEDGSDFGVHEVELEEEEEEQEQKEAKDDTEKDETEKPPPAVIRQKSNLSSMTRYRTKRQLNKAAQKEMAMMMDLDAAQLPAAVSAALVAQEWTVKESFEVLKQVLAAHEGLFEHAKVFYVQHLQEEIRKKHLSDAGTTPEEDGGGDAAAAAGLLDAEEALDSDVEEAEEEEMNGLGALTPINAAKSAPSGKTTTYKMAHLASKKKKSIFVRPSHKMPTSMIMHANTAMIGAAGTGGITGGITGAKMTTDKKIRSSRFFKSQRNALLAGGVSTRMVLSQKKDNATPRIIAAKNFGGGSNKNTASTKITVALTPSAKKKAGAPVKKSHHEHQSTDIAGWENAK